MRFRHVALLSVAALIAVAAGAAGLALQNSPRNADADWPTYNRDLAGTRYSPLTQINTNNVATLKQVWSYRLRPEAGVVARLSASLRVPRRFFRKSPYRREWRHVHAVRKPRGCTRAGDRQGDLAIRVE